MQQSLRSARADQILSAVKYTGLLLVLGGAAFVLSLKLLRHTSVRPTLGSLSEHWLYEKRRHSNDQ